MRSIKTSRRPFLLLEVMIAIVLVALCAIPLLYPHFYMLKEERNVSDTIELQRLVNQFHVEILEQLHKNEIDWKHIENEISGPLESEQLNKIGHEGSYSLSILEDNPDQGKYLLQLTLSFKRKSVKGEPKTFNYSVFVKRKKTSPLSSETDTEKKSTASLDPQEEDRA
jgi:hypothetical protein